MSEEESPSARFHALEAQLLSAHSGVDGAQAAHDAAFAKAKGEYEKLAAVVEIPPLDAPGFAAFKTNMREMSKKPYNSHPLIKAAAEAWVRAESALRAADKAAGQGAVEDAVKEVAALAHQAVPS